VVSQSNLLAELRPQLESLDDEALAALASVGLLRRARKDLESQAPVARESGRQLEVDLGTQKVTFDSRGPSRATCTCPAKSTCQHVLAAWIHLRSLEGSRSSAEKTAGLKSRATEQERSHDLVAELMSVSPSALIEFAGLQAVREALADVMASDLPAIELDRQVKIRLSHPPVEVRYAGGGLESFIFEYRGRQRKALIARAVLAFQRANGASIPPLPAPKASRRSATPHAPHEQPATRRLLTHVLATLAECIELGVPHLSENMAERLLSHSAAAEGADLHRLSLALSRLAHHVGLQLELNAESSSAALLSELAQAFALASAIRDSSTVVPGLWGEARSEYENVSRLELIGVAAEPWRTESGYSGLTLFLWSPGLKRWYSATEARPVGLLDFDPVNRYRASGPWAGCESPAVACGAQVILSNARVNRSGRISLASDTRAQIVAAETWPDFPGREFSSWEALKRSREDDLASLGLADADPHADYYVLHPKEWLEPRFDGATQEFYMELIDDVGLRLTLNLRYSKLAKHAIERLEVARPKAGARLFVRLERGVFGIRARPIALLQEPPERKTDNLFLDDPPPTSIKDAFVSKIQDLLGGTGGYQDREPPARRLTATEIRLRSMEGEILRLAEKGLTAQPGDAQKLMLLEESLRKSGLNLLPVDSGTSPRTLAERLLRLTFCIGVVRQLGQ
jgi:hypothetical protein